MKTLHNKGVKLADVRDTTIERLNDLLTKVRYPLYDLYFIINGSGVLAFHGEVLIDPGLEDHVTVEVKSLKKRVDELFPETEERVIGGASCRNAVAAHHVDNYLHEKTYDKTRRGDDISSAILDFKF